MADASAQEASVLSQEARLAARYREPDRYLAALLAPRTVRADLVALAAFSGELLRIVDSAREPMIGQIRLQWWHDTLQHAPRSARSGHPLADVLGDIMRRRRLPFEPFGGLIEARIADLQAEAIADDAMLDTYLLQSEGGMFELALRILGVEDAPRTESAVRQSACAYGIPRALARLPAALRRGRVIVPQNRLKAAGVEIPAGDGLSLTPALAKLLGSLCQEARAALASAREAANSLARDALPALLPLVMVEPYLRALEREDFDPLAELVQVAPLRRVWRIWWAHWRGQV